MSCRGWRPLCLVCAEKSKQNSSTKGTVRKQVRIDAALGHINLLSTAAPSMRALFYLGLKTLCGFLTWRVPTAMGGTADQPSRPPMAAQCANSTWLIAY
eukprot:scaffold1497_cov128-Isochrysis_galbana.AAC.2